MTGQFMMMSKKGTTGQNQDSELIIIYAILSKFLILSQELVMINQISCCILITQFLSCSYTDQKGDGRTKLNDKYGY